MITRSNPHHRMLSHVRIYSKFARVFASLNTGVLCGFALWYKHTYSAIWMHAQGSGGLLVMWAGLVASALVLFEALTSDILIVPQFFKHRHLALLVMAFVWVMYSYVLVTQPVGAPFFTFLCFSKIVYLVGLALIDATERRHRTEVLFRNRLNDKLVVWTSSTMEPKGDYHGTEK